MFYWASRVSHKEGSSRVCTHPSLLLELFFPSSPVHLPRKILSTGHGSRPLCARLPRQETQEGEAAACLVPSVTSPGSLDLFFLYLHSEDFKRFCKSLHLYWLFFCQVSRKGYSRPIIYTKGTLHVFSYTSNMVLLYAHPNLILN